jgi:hypothetical protein
MQDLAQQQDRNSANSIELAGLLSSNAAADLSPSQYNREDASENAFASNQATNRENAFRKSAKLRTLNYLALLRAGLLLLFSALVLYQAYALSFNMLYFLGSILAIATFFLEYQTYKKRKHQAAQNSLADRQKFIPLLIAAFLGIIAVCLTSLLASSLLAQSLLCGSAFLVLMAVIAHFLPTKQRIAFMGLVEISLSAFFSVALFIALGSTNQTILLWPAAAVSIMFAIRISLLPASFFISATTIQRRNVHLNGDNLYHRSIDAMMLIIGFVLVSAFPYAMNKPLFFIGAVLLTLSLLRQGQLLVKYYKEINIAKGLAPLEIGPFSKREQAILAKEFDLDARAEAFETEEVLKAENALEQCRRTLAERREVLEAKTNAQEQEWYNFQLQPSTVRKLKYVGLVCLLLLNSLLFYQAQVLSLSILYLLGSALIVFTFFLGFQIYHNQHDNRLQTTMMALLIAITLTNAVFFLVPLVCSGSLASSLMYGITAWIAITVLSYFKCDSNKARLLLWGTIELCLLLALSLVAFSLYVANPIFIGPAIALGFNCLCKLILLTGSLSSAEHHTPFKGMNTLILTIGAAFALNYAPNQLPLFIIGSGLLLLSLIKQCCHLYKYSVKQIANGKETVDEERAIIAAEEAELAAREEVIRAKEVVIQSAGETKNVSPLPVMSSINIATSNAGETKRLGGNGPNAGQPTDGSSTPTSGIRHRANLSFWPHSSAPPTTLPNPTDVSLTIMTPP